MSARRWVCTRVPQTTLLKHTNHHATTTSENKHALLRVNETATLFTVLHPDDGAPSHRPWITSQVHFQSELQNHPDQRTAAHFTLACQSSTPKSDWRACALVAVNWRADHTHGLLLLPPVDVLSYAAAAAVVARPGSALATCSSSFASHDDLLARVSMLAVGSVSISIALCQPEHVEHDFQSGLNPAVVPVDVHVRYNSPRLVDVNVTAALHDQIADAARGRYWAGDVSLSLRATPSDADLPCSLHWASTIWRLSM